MRARETARALSRAFEVAEPLAADGADAAAVLAAAGWGATGAARNATHAVTVIVGHEPSLSAALARAAGFGDLGASSLVPRKGGLVWLQRDCDTRSECATRVRALLGPEDV